MTHIPARDTLNAEFSFQTSRSSGAGGQNVNKVETRVELLFNIDTSVLLDDMQKEKIRKKLATKIDNTGILHVVSQVHRSQLKNKETAIEKFYIMLEKALTEAKPRKPSKPSKAAKERRLSEKRLHSLKKKERGRGME